tara:strand:- start:339 stop:488 length:150 start_codon:yes stop_codon:yes gene_type:complete
VRRPRPQAAQVLQAAPEELVEPPGKLLRKLLRELLRKLLGRVDNFPQQA